MNKTVSMTENKNFLTTYKKGKFYCGKYLVAYALINTTAMNRLGITISRKVGKSVKRNRIRRLVRQNYSELEDKIKQSYDIVLVARRNAVLPTYYDIKKEMKYLFRKLDLLEVENFQC